MRDDTKPLPGSPGGDSGNGIEPPAPRTKQVSRPTLTLDVSLYEKHLADSDMTQEQKQEFLEALWTIIVSYVDLGFGIHPVQQACEAKDGVESLSEACESFSESCGNDGPDLLSSNDRSKTENPNPAGGDDHRRAERQER